jgi:hypothetical protein
MILMSKPITLTDLYEREALCKVSPNYSTDLQELNAKQVGLTVMVSMAAYRLMPILSWLGGPFEGQEISEDDKQYALFNFAGGLQLLLRMRQDEIERDNNKLPQELQEGLARWANWPDLKEGEGYNPPLDALFGPPIIDRPAPYLFVELISSLWDSNPFYALLNYLRNMAPILHMLGFTVEDLARAYLEATKGAIPQVAHSPQEGDSEEGEIITGVIYPGATNARPPEDKNGPEWAAVNNGEGMYRARCLGCDAPRLVAIPLNPGECYECGVNLVYPEQAAG